MTAPASRDVNSRSILGRYDLHVHTTMSDGDLSLVEVVEAAAQRGVTIGVADHVSLRNPAYFVSSVEEFRSYVEALSGAPVLRGGEFCWCDRFVEELPGELLERLDYRIGSNHGFTLPDGSSGSPWWTELPPAWSDRPQEVMDAMAENLCDLVREMPIQIVAHATLTPPALLRLEPDIHAWWSEEREDRFVEALRQSGVALEISNRYRLPHERLLTKAKQAGVRFSLGSDGHSREQVARLDWAIEVALRLGIDDEDLYLPDRAR